MSSGSCFLGHPHLRRPTCVVWVADSQGMQTGTFAVAVPFIDSPAGSRLLKALTGKICGKKCGKYFKIIYCGLDSNQQYFCRMCMKWIESLLKLWIFTSTSYYNNRDVQTQSWHIQSNNWTLFIVYLIL